MSALLWSMARRSLAGRLRVVFFLLAAGSLATGCALLLKATAAQPCATDGECQSRGESFRTSVCDPSVGVCVASRTSDAGDGEAQCTNASCIDSHNGDPYICDKAANRCVPVLSDDCAFIIENDKLLRNDNTLIVPIFAYLPSTGALVHPTALSLRLALKELEAAAGLPPGAQPQRRPVVGLLCDPTYADGMRRGIDHVVNDIKPPAVIMEGPAELVTELFQDKLLPAGIFMLNINPESQALSALSAKGLLWQMFGKWGDLSPTTAALLARSEAYVRNVRLPSADAGVGSGPIRVATIYTDDSNDVESVANYRTILRFNGATAGENENAVPPTYLSRQIQSAEKHPGASFTVQLNELLAFKPHIIVANTALELRTLAQTIDEQWSTAAPNQPRPIWIVGARVDPAVPELLINSPFAGEASSDAAFRYLQVLFASPRDRTEQLAFTGRMRDTYGTGSYDFYASYYDAMYWIAYGITAARQVPTLDGQQVGVGVRRLQKGPEVAITGTDGFTRSSARIAAGVDGTYQGPTGPPDMDPASGARVSQGSVTCFRTRTSGPPWQRVLDTLALNDAGTLSGYLNPFCFPAF